MLMKTSTSKRRGGWEQNLQKWTYIYIEAKVDDNWFEVKMYEWGKPWKK
jgi:hypothetical protein